MIESLTERITHFRRTPSKFRYPAEFFTASEVNFVVSHVRFRFKPLRLEQEGSLVLGLFTDEPIGSLRGNR